MLTFFTTAKPFRGHNGIIQRNALKSWTLLHPDAPIAAVTDYLGKYRLHASAYFMQWKRAQEQDGFLLEAPGRWTYIRQLLGQPWTYGEIMTPRHRVYSYMRACSALVLSYHHLHLFVDARRKRKEWTASSSEKTLVALHARAKAAAATKS